MATDPGQAAAEAALRALSPGPAANGAEPPDESGRTSWAPVDLAALDEGPPPQPEILRTNDGERALVYVGKRHLVTGKPEAAKSWFCLACCLDVIRGGKTAAYFDFDLMGAAEAKRRMRALGASDEDLVRLLFVEPDAGFDDAAAAWWAPTLATGALGIAVFDAQNPGLELHGLKPNSDEDVARFQRVVIGHFHRAGVTTIVADHLPKDREAPPEYAINSQRKLAGVDVCLRLELTGVPMQRGGKPTSVSVSAMKDRPAGLDRSAGTMVGRLRFDPAQDGSVKIEVEMTGGVQAGDMTAAFRPTHLMERTSRFLEVQTGPASQSVVEAEVKGNRDAKRVALRVLVREGYVTRERDGQAWMHRSERPYREAEDPASDRFEGGVE